MKHLLLFFALLAPALAQELHVAAAADLSSALPKLVQQFESAEHCRVIVSYGSSGNFFQQLQNGAPFDVFLSADVQYPQHLSESGLTAGNTVEYASGRIVLWTRNNSHLEISKGLKSLVSAQTIAIANPAHAPYGRAAVSAIRSEGLYNQLSPKFVLGENISQAALFAQSGSADAGILALSLAFSPSMQSSGHYVEVPTSEYPPLRQAAVVMKSSKQQALAKRFVAFLSTDPARKILQQFGFAK
ncbi:MAG TPA: molybdate ABC transporter substrate-binding protein [Candidatus Koribacter sp.]